MLRKLNIIIGLVGLQMLGCQINESDSTQQDFGVIQGSIAGREVSGSGVVFLRTDSTYHLRALIGKPNEYMQFDISFKDLNPGTFEFKSNSNEVSIVQVVGGDAVDAIFDLKPLEKNTLILKDEVKSGRTTGILSLMGYNKGDETSLKVDLSFTFAVTQNLNSKWDCNFSGERVKECHFLE